MVVVVAVGYDGLVEARTLPQVGAMDQPQPLQRLEGAIDARDPDTRARFAKECVQVLGREAAALSGKHLDYLRPGTAVAKP